MRTRSNAVWAILSAVVVTLGFIPAAGAAGAADDGKTEMIEQYLEHHPDGDLIDEKVDWEEGEVTTYEFSVPAGAPYQFTIDWETEEIDVEVGQPTHAHGDVSPLAGCISDGSGFPNAQPGVNVSECGADSTIETSISNTTKVCANDANACNTDAYPPDWSGYVYLGCAGQQVERFQWPGPSPLLEVQQCQVFTFGDSPTTWEAFSGTCGSSYLAENGLAGCIHEPGL